MRQSESRDKILEVHPAARDVIHRALQLDLTKGQLRVLLVVLQRTALYSRKGDHMSLVDIAYEGFWDRAKGPPPRRPDGSQHNTLKVIGRNAGVLAKKGLIEYQPARGEGDVGWFGLPPLDARRLPGQSPSGGQEGYRASPLPTRQKATKTAPEGYQNGSRRLPGGSSYPRFTEGSRGAGSRQPPPGAPAGLAERLAKLAGLWGDPDRPKGDVAEEAERVAFVVGLAPPELVAPVLAQLDEWIAEGPVPFQDNFPWTPSWFVHDNFNFPARHVWPAQMRWASDCLVVDEPAARLAEVVTGTWQEVAVDCGAICEEMEVAIEMHSPEVDQFGTLQDIVTAVGGRGASGEDVEPETLYEEARAWAEERGRLTSFEKCLERARQYCLERAGQA